MRINDGSGSPPPPPPPPPEHETEASAASPEQGTETSSATLVQPKGSPAPLDPTGRATSSASVPALATTQHQVYTTLGWETHVNVPSMMDVATGSPQQQVDTLGAWLKTAPPSAAQAALQSDQGLISNVASWVGHPLQGASGLPPSGVAQKASMAAQNLDAVTHGLPPALVQQIVGASIPTIHHIAQGSATHDTPQPTPFPSQSQDFVAVSNAVGRMFSPGTNATEQSTASALTKEIAQQWVPNYNPSLAKEAPGQDMLIQGLRQGADPHLAITIASQDPFGVSTQVIPQLTQSTQTDIASYQGSFQNYTALQNTFGGVMTPQQQAQALSNWNTQNKPLYNQIIRDGSALVALEGGVQGSQSKANIVSTFQDAGVRQAVNLALQNNPALTTGSIGQNTLDIFSKGLGGSASGDSSALSYAVNAAPTVSNFAQLAQTASMAYFAHNLFPLVGKPLSYQTRLQYLAALKNPETLQALTLAAPKGAAANMISNLEQSVDLRGGSQSIDALKALKKSVEGIESPEGTPSGVYSPIGRVVLGLGSASALAAIIGDIQGGDRSNKGFLKTVGDVASFAQQTLALGTTLRTTSLANNSVYKALFTRDGVLSSIFGNDAPAGKVIAGDIVASGLPVGKDFNLAKGFTVQDGTIVFGAFLDLVSSSLPALITGSGSGHVGGALGTLGDAGALLTTNAAKQFIIESANGAKALAGDSAVGRAIGGLIDDGAIEAVGADLGPIGFGISLLAAGAQYIYADQASRAPLPGSVPFLEGAGFSQAAAQAMQKKYGPDINAVPLLAQYATLRGYNFSNPSDQTAFKNWVNATPPAQLSNMLYHLSFVQSYLGPNALTAEPKTYWATQGPSTGVGIPGARYVSVGESTLPNLVPGLAGLPPPPLARDN